MAVIQIIRDSAYEIGRTDFGKFALIQSMFAVAGMWVAIFVLELEQAPGRSFLILGLGELLALGLLYYVTTQNLYRQHLWQVMLWAAIACWIGLSAAAAASLSNVLISALLILVMALLATLKRSIIADTLLQVQSGEKRHLKLALMFFLVPLLTMALSVAIGFTSDIGLWLSFALLAGILGLAATRWRGHIPLQNSTKLITRERLRTIAPRSRIQLAMGALLNLIDAPLRYVMMPVFIYSYFGGHLGKVGTALGLLSLLVLIGGIIRYSLQQQRNTPVAGIMFTSVLIFAGIAAAWGVLYNQPAIILGLFALRAMIAPVWTFGFYACLQQYDDTHFHMNSHIYALLMNSVNALGFLAMAPLGALAFARPGDYVLIAGLVETIIVLCGLALWLLAPDKMAARANE